MAMCAFLPFHGLNGLFLSASFHFPRRAPLRRETELILNPAGIVEHAPPSSLNGRGRPSPVTRTARSHGRLTFLAMRPFRRDGTPVPAQRHRRSGATASPFRREEEEKAYTPHCPPLHHPGRTPVDDKKGGPLARAAPTYNKHERKRCCVKPADGSAADLTSPHLRGASARSSAPGEP